ncbi:MAG: DUF4340 domain-containing protein [Gammaproteobacteria bacterium]
MNARRVGMLLVAAILVIVLAVWLSSRKVRIAENAAGTPVMKALKAQLNDVTEVRISKGDGSRATLRKQPTGWIVGEREYPADTTKVRKLLIDLSSLDTVEAKTSDPGKYAQLGVEDVNTPTAAGTRVEAVTAQQVHGIIIGKTSGAKSGYVRAMDAKQSVLATPMIQADADPKHWLDATLFDIPEARVKEIEVAVPSGPAYKVAREKKEQTDFTVTGVPKGRELSSPTAANGYGSALVLLALTDVKKDDATPITQPPRVTFRTFDGLELQITGRLDGDHRLVSIVPRSTAKETADEVQKLEARVKGWWFEIPNYKYDALFRPLEEMLKALEKKADTKAPAAKKIGTKPAEPALPSSPAN